MEPLITAANLDLLASRHFKPPSLQTVIEKHEADSALRSLLQAQNYSNVKDDMRKHEQQKAHVSKFKETYIKLRSDNIVLDHNTAIELAKMIYAEADTITYEDTK